MINLPKANTENLVVQNSGLETLIYDLLSNKAFCLNQTSSAVWQLCDGDRPISQISSEMSKRLKTPVSEDLIWLAIDQLGKNDLIENAPDFAPKTGDLPRREAIRKIGFSSLIALPIISSLVAPTAAQAQSCLPISNLNPGGISACSSNSECCSGHCMDGELCCLPGAIFRPHHSLGCINSSSCPPTDARCCGGAPYSYNGSPGCTGQQAGWTECICN